MPWSLTKAIPAPSWLALLAALLIVLLPQVFLFSHITDDAYIGFRYATRLAGGQGLTFNPGEHVEGFSNPLWTLMLAIGVWLTPLSAPDIARGLGLLFTALTVVGAWRFFCRPAGEHSGSVADFVLWSAIVLTAPGFHVYATAGLEGPLLMFLLFCGTLLTVRTDGPSSYGAAVMFGLVGIVRPEGALYGSLWYFLTWRMRTGWPRRREFLLLAALFLPALGYEIFRLFYFGRILPNTFVAKPPGVFGGDAFALSYLWPWFQSLGGLALVFLALVPGRFDAACKRILWVGLAPIAAAVVFVLYARGDWMPFGRFIIPIWPVVGLVVTAWVRALVEGNGLRPWKSIRCIIAEIFFLASVLAWLPALVSYGRNEGINMLMRGADQLAVGQWLSTNVRPGSTVATRRLGGISYGAPQLVFWDKSGLTDSEQAAFLSTSLSPELDDSEQPVLKRSPDILALVDAPAWWTYTKQPRFVEWLNLHYRLVRRFPQGNWGTFDIWVAKDKLSVLLSE